MNAQREPVVASAEVPSALALLPPGRWLVAVSGGRDSMVLLHAMARARRGEIAAVATFDHGTGPHARRAAALVEREAGRLGLPAVLGVAPPSLRFNEGEWRRARHAFLDAWAVELDAQVMTAHTRDDQVETVVQRLLRGAGPRGLAGMRAPGAPGSVPRHRPLLGVARATVAAYAAAHAVPYLDDPSNATGTHQRNRIRHELLPALDRVQPGFTDWVAALGERAAAWRDRVEALVDALGGERTAGGAFVLPVAPLRACGPAEWAVLWPALAARAGVVMDRRGIARAAAWAPGARAGQSIPLAGGATVRRTARTWVLKGTTEGAPGYILDQ